MKTISYLVFLTCTKASAIEYFWREYTGVIPCDALPAGRDVEGYDTYVGQAYIHQHGLYVGQIYPGQSHVEVACYGVKKATTNIKILCTHYPENFSWVTTDNKHFHVDMTEQSAIQGGYDFVNNKGTLHIGRLMYQGIQKVGSVASYNLEDAAFVFPHNNIERKANFYQVLVYKFPV